MNPTMTGQGAGPRPKPTCGFTGSHWCLGPNTNPNGGKICLNAAAVNAVRAKGADGKGLLSNDDSGAWIRTKMQKTYSDVTDNRTGTVCHKRMIQSHVDLGYVLEGTTWKQLLNHHGIRIKAQSGAAVASPKPIAAPISVFEPAVYHPRGARNGVSHNRERVQAAPDAGRDWEDTARKEVEAKTPKGKLYHHYAGSVLGGIGYDAAYLNVDGSLYIPFDYKKSFPFKLTPKQSRVARERYAAGLPYWIFTPRGKVVYNPNNFGPDGTEVYLGEKI